MHDHVTRHVPRQLLCHHYCLTQNRLSEPTLYICEGLFFYSGLTGQTAYRTTVCTFSTL